MTKLKNTTDTPMTADPLLAVVTPEMEQFACEYGLFIVTVGQKYINALSPDYTTESSMEIFKREYWGRKWFNNR